MFTLLILVSAGFCGSFLFCMADRWTQQRWKWIERSTCDHCGRALTFFQLLPLLSYLFSRGVTSCCGKRLSITYFISECFALIILGILTYKFYSVPSVISFYFYYIVGMILLLMSYTDLIDYWVPDSLQLVLVSAALYYNYHFINFPLGVWFLFLLVLLALLSLPQDLIGGADLKFMVTALLFIPAVDYASFILLASSSALGVTLVLKYGFNYEWKQTPFIPFLAFSLVCFL